MTGVPQSGEHHSPDRPLLAAEATELAETMRALGAASRLRVLYALLGGERTVEQLAGAAGLSPSSTSHHLRLLRALRMVGVRRDGRHAHYALHDHHVGELLAAIRHHQEHVRAAGGEALPERPLGLAR